MSNTLATCSIIAKMTLPIIENNLGFAASANRDYEDEYDGNMSRGYAPGATISIRKPPRYTYRAGRVAVPQATVEQTVPLTLQQGGVDMVFNGQERTVSVVKMAEKVQAAICTITNEIDRQGLQLARFSAFNVLGTPGTPPATQAQALAAALGLNQRLDEMGAPRDRMRSAALNPSLNNALVAGFAGLFNNSAKVSDQYDEGMMVDALGLKYFMDQNVDVHTNGSQAVAGTNINGAGQIGSTITVVGLGGTVTRGTRITLPGCFAVNPQSRTSTGTLAQFIVTADAAAAATSLLISPAIVTSGPFQNVTASPTNTAPFVIFGTLGGAYAANVAYHRDAFTLAMVPMWAPAGGKGVIDVARASYKGMNVKVTEYFDGSNDQSIIRLDVLWGWAATYPELACIHAV